MLMVFLIKIQLHLFASGIQIGTNFQFISDTVAKHERKPPAQVDYQEQARRCT